MMQQDKVRKTESMGFEVVGHGGWNAKSTSVWSADHLAQWISVRRTKTWPML